MTKQLYFTSVKKKYSLALWIFFIQKNYTQWIHTEKLAPEMKKKSLPWSLEDCSGSAALSMWTRDISGGLFHLVIMKLHVQVGSNLTQGLACLRGILRGIPASTLFPPAISHCVINQLPLPAGVLMGTTASSEIGCSKRLFPSILSPASLLLPVTGSQVRQEGRASLMDKIK